MAETLARRSALAAVAHAGDYGTVPTSGPGVVLAERRGLAMVQLAAAPDAYASAVARVTAAIGLALPTAPNSALAAGELAALWTGPGRALLIAPDAHPLEEKLRQSLADLEVAVTALGHGRTVIRLSGSHVRDLLAKGCGLDFHPRVFGAGSAVQSGYAHVNVLLHALDDSPTVDLYAARGFAVSLWEHLLEGALEYGCRVLG